MTADAAVVRTVEIGGLQIAYDDRVLEPRPWTVLQARWAAELLDTAPPGPVLEVCSGAGHIGLVAVKDSERRLVCVDADPVACDYARHNAAAAGLADRVEVREQSLTSLDGDERFAVIIADPPWVPTGAIGRFPADPRSAIDGGPDGLALARACLAVIDRCLAENGGGALLQVASPAQVDELASELPAGLVITETRTESGRGTVALVVRTR